MHQRFITLFSGSAVQGSEATSKIAAAPDQLLVPKLERMAKLVTLQASYRVVTPLFLGGADPNNCAELRAPSIKGALRFWYRAIDPDYDKKRNEARIFGGAGKDEGQAMFLLRAFGTRRDATTGWDRRQYNNDTFNEQHTCYGARPPHASGDSRTWRINGIQYLSYALDMTGNPRKALAAGQDIHLQLTFKTTPATEDQRRILAAMWLLGHIGGLGTRSRRGFGTFALHGWHLTGNDPWTELASLQPANEAVSVEDWIKRFRCGLQILKSWFPGRRSADHTVLANNTCFHLFDAGYTDAGVFDDWEYALDAAGKTMQCFRQR